MIEELRTYKELCKYAEKLKAKNKLLQKQLTIAKKALNEIAFEIGDADSDYGYHYKLAEKALKEMEGIK